MLNIGKVRQLLRLSWSSGERMRYFSVANNTKAVASVQGTNYSDLDFFKKRYFRTDTNYRDRVHQ